MIDLTHLTPDEAQAEYRRLSGATHRPHKYGARRTIYRSEVYDSAGEAEEARRLDLRKAAGQIHSWRRGTEWVLVDGDTRRKRVVYVPDFAVEVGGPGDLELRDFKGILTPVFKLKARLFRVRYPHVPLVLVRADGSEERL